MRSLFIAAAAILAVCPSVAEGSDQLPFGEGSSLIWMNVYDGGSDKLTEKVLARGEDFEIYKAISEYEAGDASDYFALFSGIDYRSCDEAMPTQAERLEVAALWPLEEGKTAEIDSFGEATVVIGASTEFFLMGKMWPAHEVLIDYEDEEESTDERLIILDDAPITVRIHWSETEFDTVTLVTKPRSVEGIDLSEDKIGTCASLLNE